VLLEVNFELEAARARVEQAAAAYGISKSALMPYVDANAGFERSREEADDNPDSTDTENTISFGAALYWEPDIWGRLGARKEAASLMLEEKQVLADQVALEMQSLLVETWITWHASRRLEDVLTAQQTTNMQILELTELRLAQGDGNSLAVLQQKGR
jgi:outer membrane protein TolC